MSGKKKVRILELEALQRPFYVDPGSNKVSGTTGRRTRKSRVSKAVSASAKASGIATKTRRKWEAAIAKFSQPQPGYPRFLCRGIRPNSGGGNQVSEKLNTIESVVPHAFTSSEDYDLFDTPNLRQVFNAHLAGATAGNSPFPSWTPSMGVVMKYTTEDGSLAMLDTTLLGYKGSSESEQSLSEPPLVFHVPDLVKVDMAAVDNEYEFDYEFLVYRPVTKSAYHSVGIGEIRGAGWSYKHDYDKVGGENGDDGDDDDGSPCPIREEDVAVARAVAELYRRQATTYNSPAVAPNATATFRSVQYRSKKDLDEADLQVLTRLLAADLEAWRASGDPAPLVNPDQFTKGIHDSKFMVLILVDIQQQKQQQEQQQQPLKQPGPVTASKSKKRKADDEDDNADGEFQPPRPKRQHKDGKAEPVRGRPRTRAAPRELPEPDLILIPTCSVTPIL
ncbi:hypothetical protein PG994_008215 [Apiospora phragmitis]|uniref:Uncharacterized protein n=1 Tax=Apiospora phragmitis TaxID=2905665 RepID=A0ABR1UVI7_9PEZI